MLLYRWMRIDECKGATRPLRSARPNLTLCHARSGGGHQGGRGRGISNDVARAAVGVEGAPRLALWGLHSQPYDVLRRSRDTRQAFARPQVKDGGGFRNRNTSPTTSRLHL